MTIRPCEVKTSQLKSEQGVGDSERTSCEPDKLRGVGTARSKKGSYTMSKILVVYFSASGVTKEMAENLSKVIGADLFEIMPEEPYSPADLKWLNPFARCNKEKMGKKDVPFKAKVENMDRYDMVYIGFPIWYAGAPNVVKTFVGKHDFSNKRVAVFATSKGSGIGKTTEKLKAEMSAGAEIAGGKVFKKSVTDEELKAWAEDMQSSREDGR